MLRVAEVVSTFDADLLALSEYEVELAGPLETVLEEEYPYSAAYRYVTDAALFSRYPIVAQRVIHLGEMRSPLLRAVVNVDGVFITVYVVHLTSPLMTGPARIYDATERNQELALVQQALASETGPLLVMGDFNFADQSEAYRILDDQLADTFREAGQGMGFTFPNQSRFMPPLVRLDYIWHSDHFITNSAAVLDDARASDHRPVMANLTIKPS